ncbi:MAG: hypothetical protein JOY99_11835 [Sphingomonadaceae bacterium]|nr:hypothetical protein [Sphingomonadaceae bacterium]
MSAATLPRRLLLAAAMAGLAAAPALAKARHHAVHPAAPLRTGDYVCQANGAGMFPLSILPNMRYHAAAAPGRYKADAGVIHFSGGSLANQVGHLTSPTTFELGLSAQSSPYTTCNLAVKPAA